LAYAYALRPILPISCSFKLYYIVDALSLSFNSDLASLSSLRTFLSGRKLNF